MRNTHIILSIILVLVLAVPDASHAIPAFARKYGFNCNMCHTSFPKLNDFGQRVRQSGYQIPGQEGFEKNVFETPLPLAARIPVGLAGSHNDYSDSYGFDTFGFDLLAAGMFHKNVSFLVIHKPRLDAADGSASQPGTLESANVVFSNVIPDILNLRVGRFEPAYHPISSKRSYYLLQPYEVYGFSGRAAGFVFDDNQTGIELTGGVRQGFDYGFGVVNGTGTEPDANKHKDIYLALSQVLGRGEGESAGQKVSLFGYMGSAPTSMDGGGAENEAFRRLGGSLNLNWRTLNLRTLFMQGSADKALNLTHPDEDYTYTGGFAELDWAGLWNNRLMVSMLYNWVTPPEYDDASTVGAYSALARYYLGDWTAVNVALHAEYTHKEIGKDSPVEEDRVAMAVDFAF